MRKRVLVKVFKSGDFIVRCPQCPVDPIVQLTKKRRLSTCIFGKVRNKIWGKEIEILNRCSFYKQDSILKEDQRSSLICTHGGKNADS
jgi:hypothetical protein